MQQVRCWWVPDGDSLYEQYHDTEWGFPQDDDRSLFEKLSLEGFQAGLSWRTVLGKREAFREAFVGFDVGAVAAMGEDDIAAMLADARLIRHRGKIAAAIGNASVAQQVRAEFGSLAAYVWRYEGRPGDCAKAAVEARTTSDESDALSRDLRRRGWRFLGPTTAYAFAQSVGLVNDHVCSCPVRAAVASARETFVVPR